MQIIFALAIFFAAAPRVPLIDAVKSVDRDAVRALLKQNVNVNATEGDGTTALHWAVHLGDAATADLMLGDAVRTGQAKTVQPHDLRKA